MIVPEYWAEATARKKMNGRQFTLKRFGWSDASDSAAREHAEQRLQEALATLEQQGEVRRVDHKVAYNGAEGIPIREQVIARHGEVVISRNGYGALCLNTPDVLFADIDFRQGASTRLNLLVLAVLAVVLIASSVYLHSLPVFFIGGIAVLMLFLWLALLLHRLLSWLLGGEEQRITRQVEAFAHANPDLHLRLYRTPQGFRVLLMNDTYAPASDEAQGILASLGSDPLYMRMCRNQQCFRARVSPKPWRVGLARMSPPGVWPIKEERLEERERWVAEYQQHSRDFAACRFVVRLGSQRVNDKADYVRRLHDEMCQAERQELALA